mgnify:CR=1 FL=1
MSPDQNRGPEHIVWFLADIRNKINVIFQPSSWLRRQTEGFPNRVYIWPAVGHNRSSALPLAKLNHCVWNEEHNSLTFEQAQLWCRMSRTLPMLEAGSDNETLIHRILS